MGNRANVIFTNKDKTEFSPTIYLHWNGGPESIYGFLEELNRRNVRDDQCYEAARFCQIVGEYIDGGLSLGLYNGPKSSKPEDLLGALGDPTDNGLYLVYRGKEKFVERYLFDYKSEKLKKQTKDFCEKEYLDAQDHKYRVNFREFFLELKNKKKALA